MSPPLPHLPGGAARLHHLRPQSLPGGVVRPHHPRPQSLPGGAARPHHLLSTAVIRKV